VLVSDCPPELEKSKLDDHKWKINIIKSMSLRNTLKRTYLNQATRASQASYFPSIPKKAIFMKQYQIDQIRLEDYSKIKEYMDQHHGPSELGSIYWIPLPEHLYDDIQSKHSTCHPLYFVIDLQETCLTCELLIRTKNKIRCDCIKYAHNEQRDYLITFVDYIFERTGVMT
jgi:hypothetical protein